MDMTNKIDLAAEIEKYGTDCFQDFEGFSSSEEQELIINEIKKCARIFDYKETEYVQILCDVVLINIISEFQNGESDISYYIDKILESMVFYDNILSCRYLLKSGIDWNKGEQIK
jgi:hypothetical protein